MNTTKVDYRLSDAGINDCCMEINKYVQENRLPHSDTTKLVFAVEEALLAYQERFGEETRFRLELSKRSGKIHMTLSVEGEAFNPLTGETMFDSEFPSVSNLMGSFVLALEHTYKNGINRICCEKDVPSEHGSMYYLLIAVVLGFVIGFASRLLPAGLGMVFDELLILVADTITGLIKMAALPVIFLCSIKGITGCGELVSFGKIAKSTIFSFFLTMILMMLGSLVISLIVLPFSYAAGSTSEDMLTNTFVVLFSVFPDNIISPFNKGDNIKVLFLAVVTGCAILALGDMGEPVARAIDRLCDVTTTIMLWLCRPIPVIFFILVVQNIRNTEMIRNALMAWIPMVIILTVDLLAILIDAVIVSKKTHRSFGEICRFIAPAGLKGFASGSTLIAYPDMDEALREKFKINPGFVNFSLPLGCTFFHPTIVLLASVTAYFASVSGITIDFGWIVSFLLLCFLSSVAIPPVSGGVISMLALMFSSCGIDSSFLPLATSLLMIIDYPGTGVRAMLIVLETVRISANNGRSEKGADPAAAASQAL